ncbi:ABC transporter substrate-binding protein [Herbiconiux moechotypicola]|uniref:ABC transporter substrate-binding protein n=2 Tax=Herbiconiux moechotypicola TaxID=637393 RepID=A0ABP5QGF3_9MICO
MRLTLGLSDTDRARPLADGSVALAADGLVLETEVTLMPTQALFNKQLVEHTFDVCEFPVGTYVRTLEQEGQPYLALPVFPSRHFRLSCIFVNADAGIRTPADLAGRRVGIPVFDMAAAVWLRGILEEHYGLPRTAPTYVSGGLEAARSGDEHPQFYPPRFTVEHRSDKSLAQLLAEGEIDALYTARAPSTWPSSRVVRLFDGDAYSSAQAEELSYFKETGIFPPMHLVAIKRSLADAHPELVPAVYRAFTAAQDAARAALYDSTALSTLLPWQLESLLEAERQLGDDYWASGFAANRGMLEVLLRYLADDGLVSDAHTAESLFAGPGSEFVLGT